MTGKVWVTCWKPPQGFSISYPCPRLFIVLEILHKKEPFGSQHQTLLDILVLNDTSCHTNIQNESFEKKTCILKK